MIAARPAYRRTNLKFPMNRGRDDVMDNFYLQCSSQWGLTEAHPSITGIRLLQLDIGRRG